MHITNENLKAIQLHSEIGEFVDDTLQTNILAKRFRDLHGQSKVGLLKITSCREMWSESIWYAKY
jgi:hypothetical protein